MASYRLPLHKTAKRIREALGWTQERMATELGYSRDTWRPYETDRQPFPLRIVERIREITGLDPYMLAYVLYYDGRKLPQPIQALLAELRKTWEEQLDDMTHCRHHLPTGYW
jgi:transcriptional regulator with XRE-family HTH domain